MDTSEIANLREFFKAIESGYKLNEDAFNSATTDYSTYVGRSSYLSGLVAELALENELSKDALFTLTLWCFVKNSLRQYSTDPEKTSLLNWLPLFLTRDIDQRFQIRRHIKRFFELERKRMGIAKELNIQIDDVELDDEDVQEIDKAESKEEILFNFQSLHNRILARAEETGTCKLLFDEEKGILCIGNHKVVFRKFTDQYHCLRILFSGRNDLHEEWFFSAIAERMDNAKERNDKKMHNYFSAIKRKVASDAGIKDIFLTTTQSVRVNHEYLKKI